MAGSIEAKVEGTGTRVVSLTARVGNIQTIRAAALDLAMGSVGHKLDQEDKTTTALLARAERFYAFMMQTPESG